MFGTVRGTESTQSEFVTGHCSRPFPWNHPVYRKGWEWLILIEDGRLMKGCGCNVVPQYDGIPSRDPISIATRTAQNCGIRRVEKRVCTPERSTDRVLVSISPLLTRSHLAWDVHCIYICFTRHQDGILMPITPNSRRFRHRYIITVRPGSPISKYLS